MKKVILSVFLMFAIISQARLQGLHNTLKKEAKLISQHNTQPRWVSINAGSDIPADAVAGGKDQDGSDLFVAHANYMDNWHPGKTRKDWNGANIEYGGAEVSVDRYEVLAGGVGLNWISTDQGNIPANAVSGGQEGDRTLYICRCQYEGSTQLGKTWQGNTSCNIGFGGGGYTIGEYEVLVSEPPKISPSPVVSQPQGPVVAKNATCLPTEIVIASQKNVASFTYDSNNHLTGILVTTNGVAADYAVRTNPQGKIVAITNRGAATDMTAAKVFFRYDQNNVLKEMQEFTGANVKPTITETYTYNAFGQMTQMRQAANTKWGRKDTLRYSYYLYTYPNTATKNPHTIKVYNGTATGKTGTPGEIKTLTYDEKKNIGGAFPGTTDEYETFATNNVISVDISYPSADVNVTMAITFEYNGAGYPISKTYKANGGVTFTDTYTYNCK